MSRSAFIIGGTGQIGIAAAARLLADGWRVTCSHTGRREPRNVPTGAALAIADRKDTASLASAIGNVDLLIDTMAFGAAEADQLAGLSSHYGRLCVISTASVYADRQGRSLDTAGETGFPVFDGPQPETAPTIAGGPESYSRAKVLLEQRLLDTVKRPLSILRPCAIHGINSKHPREFWFVKRMLDGRKIIPLAGDTSAHFHTSATVNMASVIAATLNHDGATVLNAGDPNPPGVREIGEIIAAQLGWTGEFIPVPADSPVGGTPFSVPSDFTVSMQAAERIGYAPAASYTDALTPYLAWLKAHAADWRTTFPMFNHYPTDPFDYAAEDAALA